MPPAASPSRQPRKDSPAAAARRVSAGRQSARAAPAARRRPCRKCSTRISVAASKAGSAGSAGVKLALRPAPPRACITSACAAGGRARPQRICADGSTPTNVPLRAGRRQTGNLLAGAGAHAQHRRAGSDSCASEQCAEPPTGRRSVVVAGYSACGCAAHSSPAPAAQNRPSVDCCSRARSSAWCSSNADSYASLVPGYRIGACRCRPQRRRWSP